MLIAVVAAHNEHPPDLFPQVAPVGIGQKRFDRRTRVHYDPGTRLFPGGGRRTFGIANGLRQTFEFVLALERYELVIFFIQHVVAELGEQARQLLIDFGEPGFRRRIQPGA